MSDDSVYADDGTYLGAMVPIDGGGMALVDPDSGQILNALDENMQPLDLADLQYESGEPDPQEDPRLTWQQLAEAREEMAQSRPPSYAEWQAAQPDPEQELAALELAAEDIGRVRGHALTDSEKRALANRAEEVANATGQPLDLMGAAADLGAQGNWPLIDTSTTQGKAEWAAARVADAGDDAPDPVTGKPTAWHEPASSSERDVRVARALNFHDHGVTSAEQAEQDQIINEED